MFSLLIVEDEKVIRNGIATFFPWANLGIEVAAACEDGVEALEYVMVHDVDLILCDIRMPRMDGLAFVEKVRGLGKECGIVLISAHKDFEYARRAIELGVRRFIVKPAGYEALNDVFSKLAAELAAEAEKEELDRRPRPESFAESVARIVDEDLPGANLAVVAGELEMSPNYFSTLFRKRTGSAFSEFLSERRMAKAKELLENTEERIYRIAELVGYANPKSFMRAFKERYGTAPNEMRKRSDG